MCTHEEERNGETFQFYLFTGQTCIRESRVLFQDESMKITFEKERLEAKEKLAFYIERRKEAIWIAGRRVIAPGYLFLQEDILLVVTRQEKTGLACGRIPFYFDRRITIGSDFKNEIFYECFTFLKDIKIILEKKEENYFLLLDGKRQERTGVYVNDRVAGEQNAINVGDCVRIFGLVIWILPKLAVCHAFFGTLRVAERRDDMKLLEEKREGGNDKETGFAVVTMRQERQEEGEVCKEEIELESWQPALSEAEAPLFLQIGPMITMMVPSLVMMLLGSRVGSGSNIYMMTAVMTGTSVFFMVLWSVLGRFFKRRADKRKERQKEDEYLRYLRQTDIWLEEKGKKQKELLLKKYPAFIQFGTAQEVVVFWGSVKEWKSRMFLRLGLGEDRHSVTVRTMKKHQPGRISLFGEEADRILKKHQKILGVPVGMDLRKYGNTGFCGREIYSFLGQLLLLMAATYDRREVKLIYLYRKEVKRQQELADILKWLPQIWQEDKKRRFLAGSDEEIAELLPVLMQELLSRSSRNDEKDDVYVFLITDRSCVSGEEFEHFLKTGHQEGCYHMFFIAERVEELQGNYLQILEKEKGEILITRGVEKQRIREEEITAFGARLYARKLAYAAKNDKEKVSIMPEKVSFLELFDCQSVSQLHCLSRWHENDTAKRIRVPIGFGIGRKKIYLDIHERFHGPHGLLAGTTGSGKSELLQTFLLALTVSFRPEAVNFFIIDYKGGGLGQGLDTLPHCAGVISNLSGGQIRRALLSIKSENVRRQRLLADAGVSHIDDYGALYREGIVKEPVPHLVLVVDEFAELKKEEPEFMQEIISMAQIGRSLGVHLLLSTQKPAGTVDDRIWSNTRFRLCLRVAERQDSMDMLHRPEAAFLEGAGRCYLQVGNQEILELFQTGYSKASCGTDEKEDVVLISNTGKRCVKEKKKSDNGRTQIWEVSNYVNQMAKKAECQRARMLWMNELPEHLSLQEMTEGKSEENTLREGPVFALGKYDNPGRQRQGIVFYEPLKEGHFCICGMSGTGKSTFLQTILWQLCENYSPGRLRFLLVHSTYAGINCFSGMPHCMGCLGGIENEESFFYQLAQLIQKRKRILKGIPWQQYEQQTGKSMPAILVIIDDYGSFKERTRESEQSLIERLAKEGTGYGIYLVISALSAGGGELPGKIFEHVRKTFSLEMSDSVQYGDVMRQYRMMAMPKCGIKGRGICRVEDEILEFQGAVFHESNDFERIRRVKERALSMTQKEIAVEQFLQIPQRPDKEQVLQVWKKQKEAKQKWKTDSRRQMQLPLGYQMKNGYMQEISMEKHSVFLVSGEKNADKQKVLDFLNYSAANVGIDIIRMDRKCVFDDWYAAEISEPTATCGEVSLLMIDSITDFADLLMEKEGMMGKAMLYLKERIKEKSLWLIAALDTEKEASLIGNFWYELFEQRQCGIHLGGNAANQRIFRFDELGYTDLLKKEERGIGYLKEGIGEEMKRILLPVFEEEGDEDDTGGYPNTGA